MSEKELEVLKTYINKNLVRGFIKESTLKVEFLVLFVLKKDRHL